MPLKPAKTGLSFCKDRLSNPRTRVSNTAEGRGLQSQTSVDTTNVNDMGIQYVSKTNRTLRLKKRRKPLFQFSPQVSWGPVRERCGKAKRL